MRDRGGGWAAKIVAAAQRGVAGVLPDAGTLTAEGLAELRIAEIIRQADAIRREWPVRLVVIVLIAAVFVLYLPWYVVLVAAVSVLATDRMEQRLTATCLRHQARGPSYWAALGAVYLSEVCLCLPAAIIWHVEDPFTKAISVGVFAAAMMRLATIRSIHPATGFAGTAALASLIAVANSQYWLSLGRLDGLAFTTVIAIVSIGYVCAAIVQNHHQQRLAVLSQMAAQRASQAKSRFLAQMSHELRTPLNAIIGTGTAVFLMAEEGRIKAQMAVLLKSAEGLAVVLNDVLDVSAVEAGRVVLRPRSGDVVEEVGQTVALFRPQAEAAGLDLRFDVAGVMPAALRLDFDRLRQCLSNLLSNALKHTERGEVRVRLRLAQRRMLEIEVQDSGDGIAVGQEDQIFKSYERGGSTREGHGLGLAITRTLVEQMGGRIGLRPAARGATFCMTLPVEDAEALPDPVAPCADGADGAGMTVLVVDDIATNRLVAATYLGLLQCRVIEVAGGAGAVGVMQSGQRVDMILLDMNMPGMGGLDTLRAIRALPGPARLVPVLAMTADAQEEDRRASLAAGLDGYVTKPVHLNILRAEMDRVMQAKRANVRQSDT